ncbi:SH3 domain protein [Ascosphaera apis ARSEF 7405]|uniref:SH3 domain protein n=1 Tax=Ascosphaera apis ARSEF 7405 TaxID=392613 RepID=A0A166P270_9EURO|nr:SH3 domain protein [Ascosphaera apis ARSEF 7405]
MSVHPFTVKAIFDYASDHEDDLVFSIGQIITVTEEEDEDWYYGEYTDDKGTRKEGLFPKNFVEKYEPPRPAARPMRHRREQESVSLQSPVQSAAHVPQPQPQAQVHVEKEQQQQQQQHPTSFQELIGAGSPREERETGGSFDSRAGSRPQTAAPTPASPPQQPVPATAASPPPPAPAPAQPSAAAAAAAAEPSPAPQQPQQQQQQQQQPKPNPSPSHDTSSTTSDQHPAPAPAPSNKPPPPSKPSNSAFKDRIAAFNKSAAAPVTPLGIGAPQSASNSFIKKSFVAPPPSKNSYVPPVMQTQQPPQLVYARDEIRSPDASSASRREPRWPQQQSQGEEEESDRPRDHDRDRTMSPPAAAAGVSAGEERNRDDRRSDDEEEEQQPRTTLKERIALLQKQQLEQAARRSSEAAHKKEKPKKPAKKHVEATQRQSEDGGAGAGVGGVQESVERRKESVGAEQTGDEGQRSFEEGRDGGAVGAGIVSENEDERDEQHQQRKQSAVSSIAHDAQPEHHGQITHDPAAAEHDDNTKHTDQTNDDDEEEEEEGEDESEDEEEEEDIDPEIKRRMAIRDRMAKMSGAMGMMGMFGGPPGGMPGMLMNPLAPPMPTATTTTKKKKEKDTQQQPASEDKSEHDDEGATSPVGHAPPVPMPGLFAPKKEEVKQPQPQPQPQGQEQGQLEDEGSESEVEQTEPTSEDENGNNVAPPPPPPPPHGHGHSAQPSIREHPSSPKESRRDAPPPPPLDTRPPPPPVHREGAVPMSPRDPPPMPPTMPHKATPALSIASMSDDEMSGMKAVDSAGEAPDTRHKKLASSPEATSPITEERPYARAPPPPPVPQMPPASPSTAQRPGSLLPKRRSSTFTPTIQTVVSDDESAAYDGDYDTDMASTLNHRAGMLDGSQDTGTEETGSIPTTPYEHRPPPVPSNPPPRAAPPPPVPSTAPPPPRHSPAPPPPPPGQPPKRVSAEMNRPHVPPTPVHQYPVEEEQEEEDSEPTDREYNPPHHNVNTNTNRYSRPPIPIPTYDSSSTGGPFGSPTYERAEEESYVPKPTVRQSYHHPPPPPPPSAAPPPPMVPTSPATAVPPPMVAPIAPAPPVPAHGHHPSYSVSSPSSSQPPASSGGIPARTRQSIDITRNPRRSMDVSRPDHGRGYMAIDVDMSETSLWWAQEDTPPPVFKGRQDVLCEIEKSASDDQRMLTRDVYVLYPDYSQTVITVEYSASNPSDASFAQRHEPPPSQPRQDQLATAHEQFGRKLSSAASSKLNTTVGDGTPHALVRAVLEPLKKDALMPVGVRAYGAQVYSNMANASVQQSDVIQPGDIVTFRSASFRGHKGTMHQRYSVEVGKPDHVAIVVDWDGTKKKIRALEQGRESRKVKIESFKLSDMKSGECRVWRIMPRSWVGWDAAQ